MIGVAFRKEVKLLVVDDHGDHFELIKAHAEMYSSEFLVECKLLEDAEDAKAIAEFIGVKSASTAHFHLERLENKGFIRRGTDGLLELLDRVTPELGPTAVPLVGVIAAGRPIEAIEQSSTIEIPPSMIDGRGEVYCLEVSGNSMIDEHICDRDIVVIKKQESAEDGQIVVALLEDGSATLKRYRRLKNGSVMLIPANPTMQPITVDKVAIQGRLIGVIRELH